MLKGPSAPDYSTTSPTATNAITESFNSRIKPLRPMPAASAAANYRIRILFTAASSTIHRSSRHNPSH
ncbi:MAG: hypothetical protein IPL39_02245 [Opitutaceae bacterium]|nr:hypothetical protein [Opitutaceae bacterium]